MQVKTLALVLAAIGSATMAQAQTLRPTLDYASAATIRDTCLAWADERNFELAIAVFDDAGRLIAFAHMDGTATAVGDVARWKGESAASYRFSSRATGEWNGQGAPRLAHWEGGVPIFDADGMGLGGVGVSGAESSDDVACAVAGIEAAGLLTRP